MSSTNISDLPMLLQCQVLIQTCLVAVLKFIQNKQWAWNWGRRVIGPNLQSRSQAFDCSWKWLHIYVNVTIAIN